jgi:A/G-specific adenine glycosylase
MFVSDTLIRWYEKNKRDLPWRQTKDPYRIWLSEVILQQTRVAQGMSYYHRFLELFPDIISLADAPEPAVLKAWQGLGYYRRARNLHIAARHIRDFCQGVFPRQHADILALKGVGEYTAAAIASFAFDLPHPVVDGNVNRFVSRYFGVDVPVDSGKGKKQILLCVDEIFDRSAPAIFNQAIMEFGSLVCSPAPSCMACPLADSCHAFRHRMTSVLPRKSKAKTPVQRYFHYFLVDTPKELFIRHRTEDDIWKNLYDLPLIETPDASVSPFETDDLKMYFGNAPIQAMQPLVHMEHKLTHRTIHAFFYRIAYRIDYPMSSAQRIPFSDFSHYPVPVLIQKFFERHADELLTTR